MGELGLEVRSGLHTGECEVVGEKLGGIAVHIGARVAGSAQAGEVLVSSTVKDLVAGSGIEFEDRGEHTPSKASPVNGGSTPCADVPVKEQLSGVRGQFRSDARAYCTTRIDESGPALAEAVVIDGVRPEVNDLVYLPAPGGENKSVMQVPANMNVGAGAATRHEPRSLAAGRRGRSHSNVRTARGEEPG